MYIYLEQLVSPEQLVQEAQTDSNGFLSRWSMYDALYLAGAIFLAYGER